MDHTQKQTKSPAKKLGDSIYIKARSAQRAVQDWLGKTCALKMLNHRAEEITTVFEEYIAPGSKVLDLGAAYAFYDKPITARGHTYTGLDVYRPSWGMADIMVYDGKKIPFPDQYFDVTILVTVLHHVDDIDALMKDVWRVTKGRVIVVEDVYHTR